MERTLAARVCLGIGLRFGRGRVGVRLLPCPGFRALGRPPMVYCESLAGMLTSCHQGCWVGRGDCIGQEILGRTDADPRRDLIRQSEANHSQDDLGWSHEQTQING